MREINQRTRPLASGARRLLHATAMAVLLVVGAVAATALVPRAADAQRAELERTIRRRVLPNGLEIIVVPSGGVPLATIELVVKNGAFTQPPEYAGLAHLYEHMFFKANDTYPEPDAFMDRAANLGALFNASTREELVNYYVTVVSDSVEGGMRFLSAALRGAQFRADELDREKEVVLGEYDRAESSPWFRLDEAIGRKLWGDFWSRKNTIGDRGVISRVTPEQMRTIRDLYYVPNNAALIIAGDVQAERMFALAEQVFGSWPRGEDPFTKAPVPAVAPLTGNLGIIVEEDVNAVTVQIQWHGPSASKDEAATFAADVYSDVLNQPSSRFQAALVESGLWQGIIVNYYTLNHVGPITVSGQTSPEKLREALAALHTELRATLEPGYFKDEELAAVKANRAVTTAFGQERASENAHTIGFWWSVVGLEYHLRYVDEMARQTPADLQRYAQGFIVGKPHITGVMLPRGGRRALGLTEAELAGLGGIR
jgi:zinc protease